MRYGIEAIPVRHTLHAAYQRAAKLNAAGSAADQRRRQSLAFEVLRQLKALRALADSFPSPKERRAYALDVGDTVIQKDGGAVGVVVHRVPFCKRPAWWILRTFGALDHPILNQVLGVRAQLEAVRMRVERCGYWQEGYGGGLWT